MRCPRRAPRPLPRGLRIRQPDHPNLIVPLARQPVPVLAPHRLRPPNDVRLGREGAVRAGLPVLHGHEIGATDGPGVCDGQRVSPHGLYGPPDAVARVPGPVVRSTSSQALILGLDDLVHRIGDVSTVVAEHAPRALVGEVAVDGVGGFQGTRGIEADQEGLCRQPLGCGFEFRLVPLHVSCAV